MIKGKHVLFMTYDGLCDPLGQSQVLPYIEGLSRCGYRFSLFTFEKSNRYRELGKRLNVRCEENSIAWHPLRYTKKPPIGSTVYDMKKLYTRIKDLHSQKPIDLIHSRSYLPAIIALKLKKKYSIPFLFDMRGFYADERVDGKIWNLKNPTFKIVFDYFKKNERKFIEEASAIVSLTNAGKFEIERWFLEDKRFGGDENYYNFDIASKVKDKISVIPCTVDLDHFQPKRISQTKRKWACAQYGLDPDLDYLGYVGSMHTWYMSYEMIDCYAEILKTNPQVRFLVLSHDDISAYREYAESLGIPNSYLIKVEADRKDVPALLSLMSASIFFILPAYSKKASSPTKQGELMAMGIPVICNDGVGDSGEIVRRYNAGFVIDDCKQSEYKRVALNWQNIINLDPNRIRKGAEDYLSLKSGILAFENEYQKCLI